MHLQGSWPFCNATKSDCGKSSYIVDSPCGDGLYCLSGKKILCAN